MQMEAGFGNILYVIGFIIYILYSVYKAANKQSQKKPNPFPPITSKPGSGNKKSFAELLEELTKEVKPEPEQPEPQPIAKTPASHQSHMPQAHTPENKPRVAFDYSDRKIKDRKPLEQIPSEEPHLQHAFGKMHDLDEEPVNNDEPTMTIMGIEGRKAMILSDILKRPEY